MTTLLPTIPSTGMTYVSAADAAELADAMRSAGWLVLQVPPGIRDKDSFLVGLRQVVPLDPMMLGPANNWDALRDSLWNGLCALPDPAVAIVWSDAVKMRDVSPTDFEVARSILAETAFELGDARLASGPLKRIAVILGGRWYAVDGDAQA